MDRFPTDLLVYGAVFLMILLFNYLARKRAGEPVPPAQDPGQDDVLTPGTLYEPDEPPSEFWGRVPPAPVAIPIVPEPVARVGQRAPVAIARRAPRYSRRSLFGSQHDVRKAIVLMTVLGPPRGAEPPADEAVR